MALSLKVIIIDDQPALCKEAAWLVAKQPGFIVAGSCGSVREALQLIPSIQPDLLLLDINLGDGTGFDLLEKISPISFKVIFLTAHQQHAIRAIKYGALDYLLKPLTEHELQQALSKAIQAYPARQEQFDVAFQHLKQEKVINRLVLRSQEYLHVVELDEIIYCQSHTGYTTFFLTDKRKVITSRHLKEYEDILPPGLFLRPHQSYLVNSRYIYKYHKDGYLVLRDNTEIPVATRKKEIVISYLNQIH